MQSSIVKVGVVTLIALFFLAASVFIVGDIQIINKKYKLIIRFKHVDGLLKGSKVTFAGVKVGKVEQIDIKGGIVYVTISISENIKIPKCVRFTIDTAGLMGEKYLGIDMDECYLKQNQTLEYYKENDIADGIEPLRLSQLFSEGEKIMQKVSKSIDSVNKVLTDEKVIDSTKNTILNIYEISLTAKNFVSSLENRFDEVQTNITDLIYSFNEAGEKINTVIEENRIQISELIKNYKDFGAELNDVILKNKQKISELITKFNNTATHLNKLIEKVEDNGNTAEKVKEMLENFRQTSKNVEEATNSLKEILTDETLETEVKGTIRSISNVAKKADSILSALKGRSVKLLYTLRGDKNEKITHNDMAIDFNFTDDKAFLVGVRNIGNGNQLDAQLSHKTPNSKLTKRMGIIKSKVGFGVDYQFNNRSKYSIDFIDTHDTQVETTSIYKIKDNISLQTKTENVLKKQDRNYSIGIQYVF